MKSKKLRYALTLAITVIAFVGWQTFSLPTVPTILSFRIGQSFDEVAKSSTYPVWGRSNVPMHAESHAGHTFVTEPAVILRFADPDHGFTLPATKFAVISYRANKVASVATSPMLETLPYPRAITILEDLQNQFKSGGWEPWRLDGSLWFDLTPDGKRRLYAKLRQPGFAHEATLRVPGKYSMVFRIRCASGCSSEYTPSLFLIDVGVCKDLYEDFPPDYEPTAPRGY